MRIAYIRMKIATPKSTMTKKRLERIANSVFRHGYIQTDWIYVEGNYDDVPLVVAELQKTYDGLLFSGRMLYYTALRKVTPTCIWEYVTCEGSTLIRALFEAQRDGYDGEQCSIDSFSEEQLKDLLLDTEKHSLMDINYEDFYDSSLNQVYIFHKTNYEQGRCSCCITAFSAIETRLRQDGIPVYLIGQDVNSFYNVMHRIYFKHQASIEQYASVAVLAITFSHVKEYSVLSVDEYLGVLDRLEAEKLIYQFSETLQAAITPAPFDGFYLFCDKNLLESITTQYENMSLLNQFTKNLHEQVYIGIGYGTSIQQSKKNAVLAMRRAETYPITTLMIYYPNHICWGPFQSEQKSPQSDIAVDPILNRISEKTGIGIQRLIQLQHIIKSSNKESFLAADLAKECGLSTRSMNRIVDKLRRSGYASIVGKLQEKKGRPQHLIQFKL